MQKNEVMPKRMRVVMLMAASLAPLPWLVACGGGGGGDAPASAPAAAPVPPGPAPTDTSYLHFKNAGLVPQTLPSGDKTVRAYGNFAGNGRLDYFRAVSTYDVTLPAAQATPGRFEFYAKQADGSFVLDTARLPVATGCVQPGKAIVGDFNGDGRPDVFVACYGYDAPPYPGERNKVVLSQPDGTYVISDASTDSGFNHGATAADLNGDGKLDVVVVNNFDADRAYTLINDGTGHFTREASSRLPTAIKPGNYFSVELVDVNEDGWLDLVVGGHEYESAPTSVFINPGTNVFTSVAPTVVPPVANEGVVLDFTLTGSGSTRALWVLRTSGNDGTFYQGRALQKVAYPSMSATLPLNDRTLPWIPWLIPATVGGAAVVTSDNAAEAVSFPQ
jgi:hypothetical protein